MVFRRVGLLAAGVVLLVGCGSAPQKASGRLRVVTTIGVLADWARQVGGDRVEVTSLLSGNESPHTYEIKPADVKTVADARILFRVGLGLEDWLDAAIENSGNRELVVVDAAMGVNGIIADTDHQPKSEVRRQRSEVRNAESGPDHQDTKTPRAPDGGERTKSEARASDAEIHHQDTKTPRVTDEGERTKVEARVEKLEARASESPIPSRQSPVALRVGNPHIWLDPEFAKVGTENLVTELVRLDPQGESLYRRREAAYFARLDSLSAAIAAEFAGLNDKRFITYHDAWPYFARRFGLDIVATVEPIPGQEPSARELARLVDLIRAEHIKVITTEPQLPSALPNMLARETGVKVVTLNPLLAGSDGTTDYMRRLGASADVLAGALR